MRDSAWYAESGASAHSYLALAWAASVGQRLQAVEVPWAQRGHTLDFHAHQPAGAILDHQIDFRAALGAEVEEPARALAPP